ncbi:MAG: transglycosylase SLT domain-containing protein [Candidatus Eisenbacteria bacterium]|nr:transglycosylase SLT domain-containing protein [Candidatus Eisenbacteria bacterium]
MSTAPAPRAEVARVDAPGLDAARAGAQRAKLKKTCQQFEAVLVARVLQDMRRTTMPSGLFGKGMDNEVYGSFMDQAVAEKVAARSGFGVAPMMERTLADRMRPQPERSGDGAPIRLPRGGDETAGAPVALPRADGATAPAPVALGGAADALPWCSGSAAGPVSIPADVRVQAYRAQSASASAEGGLQARPSRHTNSPSAPRAAHAAGIPPAPAPAPGGLGSLAAEIESAPALSAAAPRGRAIPAAPDSRAAGTQPAGAPTQSAGPRETATLPAHRVRAAARPGPADRTAAAAAASGARRASPELQPMILRAAHETGVDSRLLEAVLLTESAGRPRAVSPKGASGLMQLMPDTARAMGVKNVFDPWENVRGGARYLAQLLDRFGGSVTHALAAYNAGPTAVERHGGVPPYPETRRYVRQILGRLDRS